ELLEAARARVGRTRAELDEAWDDITELSPQPKVASGLRKLIDDACTFEGESALNPASVRRLLFARASQLRREGARLDRVEVIAQTASELAAAAGDVERALFADLRAEHVLRAAPTQSGAALV